MNLFGNGRELLPYLAQSIQHGVQCFSRELHVQISHPCHLVAVLGSILYLKKKSMVTITFTSCMTHLRRCKAKMASATYSHVGWNTTKSGCGDNLINPSKFYFRGQKITPVWDIVCLFVCLLKSVNHGGKWWCFNYLGTLCINVKASGICSFPIEMYYRVISPTYHLPMPTRLPSSPKKEFIPIVKWLGYLLA